VAELRRREGAPRTAGGLRGAEWREREAELYLAAGRFDIAARLLQDVGGRGEWRYKYLAKARDPAPDFPRDLGLEMRWAAVHSRTSGTDTAAVQALLDESAEGQGIMPWEEGRHASVWTLVDRLLAAQKPEVLAPLRLAQERQAADLVERARRTGDPQAMLVLSRRFPWAPAVHEAMVACGEQMLRRGYVGQAHRAFEDVLAHAGPGETRAKAQVGLWLALASETRDRGALQAAFDGVAPDAEFPWMGERASASRIRERLLAGLEPGEGAAPALAGLAPQLVRIPPTCPWDLGAFGRLPEAMLREFPSPLGSLQGDTQRVLVAGPSLLACFGDDVSRPLWWRAPNDVERTRRRVREREGMKGDRQDFAAAPGLFQPAMAGGRVYSRWGAEPSGQALRGVAAFDAATGEIAWSTDDDPAWEEMWPASDPVVAGGRVYVLTIQDRFGPILPIHLACLDAASGRLLWQRTLGSQNPGLLAGDGTPYRRDRAIELVRYGSAVTVHRGAVYAVTNLGFAARCDARDGMVEWINTYPRVRLGANTFAILRRMGAPPVVAGDRVVCLPRDYHGLFALDRRSPRRPGSPGRRRCFPPRRRSAGCCGTGFQPVRNHRQDACATGHRPRNFRCCGTGFQPVRNHRQDACATGHGLPGHRRFPRGEGPPVAVAAATRPRCGSTRSTGRPAPRSRRRCCRTFSPAAGCTAGAASAARTRTGARCRRRRSSGPPGPGEPSHTRGGAVSGGGLRPRRRGIQRGAAWM